MEKQRKNIFHLFHFLYKSLKMFNNEYLQEDAGGCVQQRRGSVQHCRIRIQRELRQRQLKAQVTEAGSSSRIFISFKLWIFRTIISLLQYEIILI